MSVAVRAWLSLLLVALAAYAGFSIWRIKERLREPVASSGEASGVLDVTAVQLEPPSIAELGELKFTDQTGQPFAFSKLANQVWVGSFFFASCPGPCRQINAAIGSLSQELAGKPIHFVSITVDPDNDTPQVLADYAKGFGADPNRWSFLTGDFANIRRVCADIFAMPIDRKVHTERLILVDRSGRRRGVFSTGDPAQMVALKRGIDKLLAEKPEEKSPEAKAAAGGSAGPQEPRG